jgi:uncharacterized membrane protein YphA (DoxX/SURF4 family)
MARVNEALTALLPYMLTFSRLAIGFVFTVSSAGKIRNLSTFEKTIANFQILPRQLTRVSAYVLLASELAVVVLLLIGGKLLTPGFSLAILLLAAFCVALLSVLVRRIQTACHCFGSSQRFVTVYDIWRNAGLIACALAGLASYAWMPIGSKTTMNGIELGLLGLIAIVFVVLCVYLGEIIETLRTS